MRELIDPVLTFAETHAATLARVAVILVLAWLFTRLGRRVLIRHLAGRIEPSQVTLGRVLITYVTWGVAGAWALQQLGFNPSVLLGAAGIITVAVGFASQTSMSNAISGLFLIVERPFSVGDIIEVEGLTGVVHSIDLMSVKLRTFDNRYVRVPNESMLKQKVTTLTRFPIRRADIDIAVTYDSDLERVREVLLEVARVNPDCMEEPPPMYLARRFGNDAIEILFGVWVRRDTFYDVRTELYHQIKAAFDREGVVIAFPQRVLHPGKDPFVVELRS